MPGRLVDYNQRSSSDGKRMDALSRAKTKVLENNDVDDKRRNGLFASPFTVTLPSRQGRRLIFKCRRDGYKKIEAKVSVRLDKYSCDGQSQISARA